MASVIDRYAEMLIEKEISENTLISPFVWREENVGEREGKKTLYGLCRSCMQGDCVTLVHMENGVVTGVEGREGVPPNYGKLCPRGKAATMNLYNPYRVKTPLMRTNPEKGLNVDPRWKEISWDEALTITANELKKVYDEDPRGFLLCEGWGERDTILRNPFRLAFGTPNSVGSHGPTCSVHYATNLVMGSYPVSVVDLEYCNYHITIGRSLGPNFATSTGTRLFTRALERGMKLICVDPRCSYEASKGEWVPIAPGEDFAFVLGMAHSMMYDVQVYDTWFLKNRTNCPYLLDEKDEYIRDKETGKPLCWDLNTNKEVPFDTEGADFSFEGIYTLSDGKRGKTSFTRIKEDFARYTPEWAEALSTVPAATIRRIAKEFVEHASIGSTITIDGFEFPFRPVSLNIEKNTTNHRGGTYTDLVGKMINMMVGSIEVPGGCLGCGYRCERSLRPNEDGTVIGDYECIDKPWSFPPDHVAMTEFFPNSHTTLHVGVNAMLEPEKFYMDYTIKAWLTIGGNPIRTNCEPHKYIEAISKVPFVFSIAYHIDEPTILSDIVLPEHSFMERLRVAPYYPSHQSLAKDVMSLQMVQYRQPVPALFNTWHVDDIFLELADRIGILKGEGGLNDVLNNTVDLIIKEHGLNLNDPYKLDLDKRYTLEEIFDHQIRGWMFNEKGVGLEELDKEGYLAYWRPQKNGYNYFYYPGKTTRHEFFFNHLRNTGRNLEANLRKHNITFPGVKDENYIWEMYEPIPHHIFNSEKDAPKEFDLRVMNWKTPYYSSDTANVTGNPWLAEMFLNDPYEAVACINTATAAKKNLKDGDKITISSLYGSVDAIVRTSELFHPRAVGVSGCYGGGTKLSNPLYRKGADYNLLLTTAVDSLDAVSGGQEVSPKVKISKRK